MSQKSSRKSTLLFELIKSLSKSEKRFFKIFSKRHVIGDKNNYVALFDAIERQKVYDESEIQKQFGEERFVKRLPVAKSYLYDLVLKSMNQYHAQNGVDNQVIDLCRQVVFLYEKNLYGQAMKQLHKANRLALEYEKISILPELCYWHKKIMEAQFYSGMQIEDIELLHKEESEALEQIANLNHYWLLQAKLYYQHNLKGIIRNSEDLGKIEDIYTSSLMKNEERALSYRAKILFNKIYSTYFFILRDFDSCYRYVNKMVQLYEERPSFILKNALEYVQSLNNLLNITQASQKKEETLIHLQKLRDMMNDERYEKDEKLQLKLFEAYYYHLLTVHLDQDDFKGGYSHVAEIESGFQKFNGSVDTMGELMLHYHLFQICFGAKKFTDARNWVRKIIENEKSDIRQDILSFSRILNLMVLFELGDYSALNDEIVRTYKFLKKKDSTYRFETIVADYLKSLGRVKGSQELLDSFDSLRTELLVLADDPFEKKAFAYFDFIGWLERKISAEKTPLMAE